MSDGTHQSVMRQQAIARMYAAIDRLDVEGMLAFLASDASQRFGNQALLRGTDEIRAGNEGFFASIRGMQHAIVDVWDLDDTTVIRLDVTYTRRDGQAVTLPAVTVLHRDGDGLIDVYEVFNDLGPVFA